MDVFAFSTPSRPNWRWRIVSHSGEMVEESFETFPSIATAIGNGVRRMHQLNDEDLRRSTLRVGPTYARAR